MLGRLSKPRFFAMGETLKLDEVQAWMNCWCFVSFFLDEQKKLKSAYLWSIGGV
jgi:hypothetical protein